MTIKQSEAAKLDGLGAYLDTMRDVYGRELDETEKELYIANFWLEKQPEWKILGNCGGCRKRLKKKDIFSWNPTDIFCEGCSDESPG